MDKNDPTRLDIAKEAAISVVGTLGNNDFVGLVLFSDDAYSPLNFLIRSNSYNVE